MAEYICAIRTNYFHVKDEEKFRDFADNIYCGDGDFEVWEDKDKEGKTVFGFGCCSAISGIITDSDEEDDNTAYDRFIDELQKLVAEDDAVIIYEVGREKLRYLNGLATIITSDGYKYLDISDESVKLAREMLKNEEWTTKSSY